MAYSEMIPQAAKAIAILPNPKIVAPAIVMILPANKTCAGG